MAERILIIEDEEDLVNTLEYALSKEGYEVVSSLSGGGGLDGTMLRGMAQVRMTDSDPLALVRTNILSVTFSSIRDSFRKTHSCGT